MPKVKNQELSAEIVQLAQYADSLVYVHDVDCLFVWKDEKYFTVLPPIELRPVIFDHLITVHPELNVTTALLTDIMSQVTLRVPTIKSMNMTSNNHWIVFEDGMLDTNTFELHDLNKEVYPSLYIPYSYASICASYPPKQFLTFIESSLVLEDSTVTDFALVGYVQEIMGYMLMGGINIAAAFFFVGGGSNGKSVLASIIESMFMEEYVSSMSIETLTSDKFALSSLVGKRLNVCNEDESKYIKSDRFKAIVSGDRVSAERKYGGRFDFRPQAKFLFCSNRMPSFDGLNYGIKRRMKIIPFHRRFTDIDKDIHLLDKLKQEMPGIIAWALEGARRLVANNMVFSEDNPTVRDALRQFEEATSSSVMFINDMYTPDNAPLEEDRAYITNEDLYKDYTQWCAQHGRKPLGSQNFHQDLSGNTDMKKGARWINGRSVRINYLKRKTYDPMVDNPVPNPFSH